MTTVEIKSGYGLDRETELRQLRAARALTRLRPADVRTTYLGLHALPSEFAADREGYLDLVCREIAPPGRSKRHRTCPAIAPARM